MIRFVSIVAALLSFAPPAQAASDEPPARGYVMPSTETWELAAESGEAYRIFVSRPEGPPPEQGYPVLYVLDGNAMFAGFAETRRIQEGSADAIGKTIVVGIGYFTSQLYDTRRLYDFTPAMLDPPPPEQVRLAKARSGGRDKFLSFLIERLRPELARRYRINPDRQALFGHSLGGLFALHALYTRPDAFHAIVAASPSLWWNEQAMLKQERDFATRLAQGKVRRVPRLMVVAGDREESIVNTWDSEAFAKRIEPLSAYGLRMRWEIYKGEGHMTVPSRTVTDTLRFVFTWP
jgi:predicted alpha/beta superfamily hydrolase